MVITDTFCDGSRYHFTQPVSTIVILCFPVICRPLYVPDLYLNLSISRTRSQIEANCCAISARGVVMHSNYSGPGACLSIAANTVLRNDCSSSEQHQVQTRVRQCMQVGVTQWTTLGGASESSCLAHRPSSEQPPQHRPQPLHQMPAGLGGG